MINDYTEEKTCLYKGENYLVRDNGCVLRLPPDGKKPRKLDNNWTFGRKDKDTGYMMLSSARVHLIVACAFYGTQDTTKFVVDHIDTNRCNNRVENLRWLTRLENVLRNPITVKKIIYTCGSLENFLENPAAYRDVLSYNQNFDWMRTVSKEEANASLKRLQSWAEQDTASDTTKPSSLGEWIFKSYAQDEGEHLKMMQRSDRNKSSWSTSYQSYQSSPYPMEYNNDIQEEKEPELSKISEFPDGITPGTKQTWRVPTEFVFCPIKRGQNPLQEYFDTIVEGATFSKNSYGERNAIKKAFIPATEKTREYIAVITNTMDPFHPYETTEILYIDDWMIHFQGDKFHSFEGADKHLTQLQGLKWTGGETIDDCT